MKRSRRLIGVTDMTTTSSLLSHLPVKSNCDRDVVCFKTFRLSLGLLARNSSSLRPLPIWFSDQWSRLQGGDATATRRLEKRCDFDRDLRSALRTVPGGVKWVSRSTSIEHGNISLFLVSAKKPPASKAPCDLHTVHIASDDASL